MSAEVSAKLRQQMQLRYVLYLFRITPVVLYVMALVGCVTTSPGIPNIYFSTIRAPTGPTLRVGFFGLCSLRTLGNVTTIACTSTVASSPSSISQTLQIPSSQQILLSIARDLQENFALRIAAAAGASFFVGLVLKVIHDMTSKDDTTSDTDKRPTRAADPEKKKFPISEVLAKGELIFISLSAVLGLLATVFLFQVLNGIDYGNSKIQASGNGNNRIIVGHGQSPVHTLIGTALVATGVYIVLTALVNSKSSAAESGAIIAPVGKRPAAAGRAAPTAMAAKRRAPATGGPSRPRPAPGGGSRPPMAPPGR